MQELVHVFLGISLSAACGFRVFIPLLALSIGHMNGWLVLSSGFEWLGSYSALTVFSVASAVEIAAYYVPWLDNLLDTIASPLAVLAGILSTASLTGDLDPVLRWSLSIIAGGSVSGIIQAATTSLRLLSTSSTGGAANPVVSTAEAGSAVALSAFSLFLPVVAFAGVLLLFGIAFWLVFRRLFRKKGKDQSSGSSI